MSRPSCVVAGTGPVGALFTGLLRAAGWRVTAVDLVPRDPATARDDITNPSPWLCAGLAAADLVLLSVPERAALAAVPALARETALEAVLVDTLSSKQRFLGAVQRLAPRPVLSLNPLFRPDLGWAGNTVAAAVVRDGGLVRALLDLITAAGAHVHLIDPDEHDRVVTSVQAATHAALLACTQAFARLGLPATDVLACAPPPARALLALTARVLQGEPDTYWDVQNAGPTARAARRALRRGVEDIDDWTVAGNDAAFHDLVARLRAWFGADCEDMAAAAARMLTTDTTTTTSGSNGTP